MDRGGCHWTGLIPHSSTQTPSLYVGHLGHLQQRQRLQLRSLRLAHLQRDLTLPDPPRPDLPDQPRPDLSDLPQPGRPDQPQLAQPDLPQPDLLQPDLQDLPQPDLQPDLQDLPRLGLQDLPQPDLQDLPWLGLQDLPRLGLPDLPQRDLPDLPQLDLPDRLQPLYILDHLQRVRGHLLHVHGRPRQGQLQRDRLNEQLAAKDKLCQHGLGLSQPLPKGWSHHLVLSRCSWSTRLPSPQWA